MVEKKGKDGGCLLPGEPEVGEPLLGVICAKAGFASMLRSVVALRTMLLEPRDVAGQSESLI